MNVIPENEIVTDEQKVLKFSYTEWPPPPPHEIECTMNAETNEKTWGEEE